MYTHLGLTCVSSEACKRGQSPVHVWFGHCLVYTALSHSFRTHGSSITGDKLNGAGDPGTTLCREHLPPMKSGGPSARTSKAELRCTGAAPKPELLPAGASRSKTGGIKCLALICSAWSFQAKGTLNYKQPHCKGKSVKHLLPGTPHSAPARLGSAGP